MRSRPLLWLLAGEGAVNVGAVAFGVPVLEAASKALLIPTLTGWLLVYTGSGRGPGRRPWPATLRWLAAGLVFAWLGDLLLLASGDAAFMAGIAAFAVMQVCYIGAFRSIRGAGLVRSRPWVLVPYLAVWSGVIVAVWPGAGAMRAPIVAYSALLVGMAIVAVDLTARSPRRAGRQVAAGAALFVVSDGVIALSAFGPLTTGPAWGVVVMATYIVAQTLIVVGVAHIVRPAQEEHR